MIEACFALLGAIAGIAGAYALSRRKRPAPKQESRNWNRWIDWGGTRREIDELAGSTAYVLLSRTAEAGRDAEDVLAKLESAFKREVWTLFRENATMDPQDPRDKMLMRAGNAQFLLALLDGLEIAAAEGKRAQTVLNTRSEHSFEEVSIG